MPHRPDGVLYLPILHHTFVPILKGEGGKRGSEGRGLGLLGSAMAVQLEPEAVELLLSWMLGSCEPLEGSPMSSGSIIPRIPGTLGSMLSRCCAEPFPMLIVNDRQPKRSSNINFSQRPQGQ